MMLLKITCHVQSPNRYRADKQNQLRHRIDRDKQTQRQTSGFEAEETGLPNDVCVCVVNDVD